MANLTQSSKVFTELLDNDIASIAYKINKLHCRVVRTAHFF